MSMNDLAGFGLLTGAALFGYRAFQQYKGQGGGVLLAPAPQPVAPDAYAPRTDWGSYLGDVLGRVFDWPSYQPVDTFGTAPAGEGVAAVPVAGTPSHDVLTLARTIYGEAASEGRAGKEAVANVVMNRVRSPRWPNSVAGVCLQRLQFSCWNANDPMRARIEHRQPGSSAVFDECLEIARQAVAGALSDRTGGATHYYANYINQPAWVRNSPNAVQTAKFGVHLFYRGIA